MRRVLLNLALLLVGVAVVVWAWSRFGTAPLKTPRSALFNSPYAGAQPLSNFLVFTGVPQPNIPDGQIHWTDMEVPGIDTLGPDGALYNVCPDEGLAWTLLGGDPYGGGKFVAVECQGSAAGWQMLAFHLCQVDFSPSPDSANRIYTRVAAGSVVGRECGGHTHLSVGYYASQTNKQSLPCPQWWVQGRYWVNAACLLEAQGLPASATARLAPEEDWELHFLVPELLNPLRGLALFGVSLAVLVYLILAFMRSPGSGYPTRKFSPAFEASTKSLIWFGFLIFLFVISAGPLWPVSSLSRSRYTLDASRYQAVARAAGYDDATLLESFYQAAVPRTSDGQPAPFTQTGKVFPPEAAAAIPFGETNAAPWGGVDPTQPGVYGRFVAWDALAVRWPPSLYETMVLGLTVSREAERQRQGLEAIANSPDMKALGQKLGKTIGAQDLYGSSAGAVGRTQILPGNFSPGGLCGDMLNMDVWNNPTTVAECTTRYLTVSGCWGRWWDNGDVWSALCGYNPGAWSNAGDQWYWNVLQDRMTRLAAAGAEFSLADSGAGGIASTSPLTHETYVSTPMLGLLVTQALMQDGQTVYALPGSLTAGLREVGPSLSDYRPEFRVLYRLFRAWLLVYYSPADLLMYGIQL